MIIAPLSYLSPKAAVKASPIQGRGLFAVEPIRKGEIVCIKGGSIFNRQRLQEVSQTLGPAEIQITKDLFIGPRTEEEREGSMIFSNHSCDPNIGVQGQIIFVAMLEIAAGEELTHDWAMTDDDTYEMECNCGAKSCRKVITGQDWRREELQERYRGFFSGHIAEQISNGGNPTAGFAGAWDVLEATLPNGQFGYTGLIDIKRNGSVYDLDWEISAGRYLGIGIPDDTHLYVGCGEQRAGLGVGIFQLGAGCEVSIRWSNPELRGAIGSGMFTSAFNGTFEGEHELDQRFPDGSPYGTWTVEIQKTDSIFEIAWRKGSAVHFRGLGLEIENGLAVSWYPDTSELALLDYSFDPEDAECLLATWALGGFTSLGSEKLKRKIIDNG
jgi:uncharacterized protein